MFLEVSSIGDVSLQFVRSLEVLLFRADFLISLSACPTEMAGNLVVSRVASVF